MHLFSFNKPIAMRRMKQMLSILAFVACLGIQQLLAQPETDNTATEEQLAGQYYQLNQWDLAADLYEVLYAKNPATFYYSQLVNCYLNMKDTKAAEKLISRQVKRNPQQLSYLVDLAYVYQESGDESKAKKQYEKALKELNPSDDRQVKELASAFQMRKQDALAEKTYIQARAQFPRPYNFQLELADIYKRRGENGKMLDEFFNLLNGNGIIYLETIQNQMQDLIFADVDGKVTEELRERLLREVQRNPDNLVFADLIVWMFLQKKDFDSAMSQSKALDKRLRENGNRVLQVARICMDNQAFEVGKKGYEYLIEKGPQSPVYGIARQELALAMYERLIQAPSYTQEELMSLENLLQQTLTVATDGISAATLAVRLGHLKAFYKNEFDDALSMLMPYTLPSNNLPSRVQNEVKLEVADIQLLMGDIWESTLTYSQIEKAMKTDTIGQEAKFRNARLAYYKGDFEWSKVQLDVLKAATSKFIANDAMELSLLIGDNMVFDTTGEALRMFSRADLWVYQNKTAAALITLDSLSSEFPETTLADDILYRKAKIASKQARYQDAADLYQQLVSIHHEDILADNALFELADLMQFKLDKKQEAMDYYKALLTEFPGSLYVAEARRRFRQLRGDNIQ
jgi:tetratricopeptide (TPR) repeat protein